MPTQGDNDSHVVEHKILLLQGATLGVSDGEAQTQGCVVFWNTEDDVQNKGHICGDLACNVGSNSFLKMHVHHNVVTKKEEHAS
jgi:hypothetical protein